MRDSKIFFIPSEETYVSDTTSYYNDISPKGFADNLPRAGPSAFLTNASVHSSGPSTKRTSDRQIIGYQNETREYSTNESNHRPLKYTKQLRLPDVGDRLSYDGIVAISETSSNTIGTRRRRSTADHPDFGETTSREKRPPVAEIQEPKLELPRRHESGVGQYHKTSNSSVDNVPHEGMLECKPQCPVSSRTVRNLKSKTFDIWVSLKSLSSMLLYIFIHQHVDFTTLHEQLGHNNWCFQLVRLHEGNWSNLQIQYIQIPGLTKD